MRSWFNSNRKEKSDGWSSYSRVMMRRTSRTGVRNMGSSSLRRMLSCSSK